MSIVKDKGTHNHDDGDSTSETSVYFYETTRYSIPKAVIFVEVWHFGYN
jgi:hypothetical protein